MFGYLVCNSTSLTKEDFKVYRGFYCGLCNRLNHHYGNLGRTTLTYDLTFINILLTSISKPVNTCIQENCPLHPLKKHTAIYNDYSDYCADMNILLNYYKYLDDYHDSNNKHAKNRAEKISNIVKSIEEKYPFISATVKQNLDYITAIEKDNILNPDLPANHFGLIMADILNIDNNEDLKNFGYHLGRFIYLMDAVVDLKDDIKNENYNPLVGLVNTDYQEMLLMIMEDVDIFYQKLKLNDYQTILSNVIYSGIWSKYQLMQRKAKKGAKTNERSL